MKLDQLTLNRVNMYASTWICTKETSLQREDAKLNLRKSSMGEITIGAPAIR
jgi:betaine lipid synthase